MPARDIRLHRRYGRPAAKPSWEVPVIQYIKTGHILYWQENILYAVPFDVSKLDLTSGSMPVIEGDLHFEISDSGTLVYIPISNSLAEGEGATGADDSVV